MSPKDSPFGGKPPTTTSSDIILNICSSMRAWNSLQNEHLDAQQEGRDVRIDLILKPWDSSMDCGNEFRCFVPTPAARGLEATVEAQKLTAVSQYR
jgi:hypothetical protein